MLFAELGRFTHLFELVGGPDSIESEGRTAFLAAVGAVADADAKGLTANGNLHLPAKAIFPKASSWLISELCDTRNQLA